MGVVNFKMKKSQMNNVSKLQNPQTLVHVMALRQLLRGDRKIG